MYARVFSRWARKASKMLVVSRLEGESVMIGDDIEIVVVATRHGKVRLGIRAPDGVTVFRSELLDVYRERAEGVHESTDDSQ